MKCSRTLASTHSARTNQRGLSLVELMVAMVIGLFLTAGVFTMFSMSSSNVTTTSQFNQLQENGRIALTILERDITQLAFMGDITGTEFLVGTNTTVDVAGIDDCIGGGVNNATLPNNLAAHFRRLWAYEYPVASGKSTLSCLTNVKNDTDVLQLKRLIGPDITSREPSKIYVIASSSEAVFVSGTTTPSKIIDNSRTWEYQHHVYFIADDTDGIPILRRKSLTSSGMNNNEQLVEGIESIHYLFGFDNDGDRTPDSYVPADSIDDLMWDNQGFQRLVAIKIFLLVRSTNEDSSYTNETTYSLGEKTLKPSNDHYRRKVLSTTVVLENPILIRS